MVFNPALDKEVRAGERAARGWDAYFGKCVTAIIPLYGYCTISIDGGSGLCVTATCYQYNTASWAAWVIKAGFKFIPQDVCLKLHVEASAASEVNCELVGIDRVFTAHVVTGLIEAQATQCHGFYTICSAQVACHGQSPVFGSIDACAEIDRTVNGNASLDTVRTTS